MNPSTDIDCFNLTKSKDDISNTSMQDDNPFKKSKNGSEKNVSLPSDRNINDISFGENTASFGFKQPVQEVKKELSTRSKKSTRSTHSRKKSRSLRNTPVNKGITKGTMDCSLDIIDSIIRKKVGEVFKLVKDNTNSNTKSSAKKPINILGSIKNNSRKIEQELLKNNRKDKLLSIDGDNNNTTKQKNIQVETPKISEDNNDNVEQENLGLNAGTFGNTSPQEPIFAEPESRQVEED